MEKEFTLTKGNYTAKEVARIMLDVIYKLTKRGYVVNLIVSCVDYGIQGARYKLFY